MARELRLKSQGIRLMARGIRPRGKLEAQVLKERSKNSHTKRTYKGTSIFIGFLSDLPARNLRNDVLHLFLSQFFAKFGTV